MYEPDEVAHLTTSCPPASTHTAIQLLVRRLINPSATLPFNSHPTFESNCSFQQLALFPPFADPPPPAYCNQTFPVLSAALDNNVLIAALHDLLRGS